MKLTEAQLKRIIEEEVQIAIDEGLLDFARGAAGIGKHLAGAAAGAAGRVAGAAKGAAEKVAGAAKGAAEKVAGAVDTSWEKARGAAHKGVSGVVQAAGKAVYTGKVNDLQASLPDLIDGLKSGKTSNAHGTNPELEEEYVGLLQKLLAILKDGQAEVQKLVGPEQPISEEAQAEAIAESIVRRITQKR